MHLDLLSIPQSGGKMSKRLGCCCLFGDVAFSEYFFVSFPFPLCTVYCMDYRARRTFFPSGWCFFYLVTTGWISDISLLCENSTNQFPFNKSNGEDPKHTYHARAREGKDSSGRITPPSTPSPSAVSARISRNITRKSFRSSQHSSATRTELQQNHQPKLAAAKKTSESAWEDNRH